MTALISYCITVFLAHGVLWGLYRLLYKNTNLFRLNRFILLFSVFLPFSIPLFEWQPTKLNSQENVFYWVDEQMTQVSGLVESNINPVSEIGSQFSWYYLLLIPFLIKAVHLLISLRAVRNQIEKLKYKRLHGLKIYQLTEEKEPHSFFHHLFLNEKLYSPADYNKVLKHEATHAKQWHTLDLILIECILVFQWFNPFIFLFRREIKQNHEFLADQAVLKMDADVKAYQFLLFNQLKLKANVLSSGFNSSLTKKRLIMMTKNKSSLIVRMSYVVVLPMVAFLFMAFSNKVQPVQNSLVSEMTNMIIPMDEGEPNGVPIKLEDVGRLSCEYGMRKDPINKKNRMHRGMDLAAKKGTKVLSIADGTVRKVQQNHKEGKAYGRFLIIDHENGYSSLYSQLSKYANIKEGQKIKKGEPIGYVGSSGRSTGPHLHYEVKKDGKAVDPAKYLPETYLKALRKNSKLPRVKEVK